jgi:hypothetical protein
MVELGRSRHGNSGHAIMAKGSCTFSTCRRNELVGGSAGILDQESIPNMVEVQETYAVCTTGEQASQ